MSSDKKTARLVTMADQVAVLERHFGEASAEADQLDAKARDGALGRDYSALAERAKKAADELEAIRARLVRARAVLATALDEDQETFERELRQRSDADDARLRSIELKARTERDELRGKLERAEAALVQAEVESITNRQHWKETLRSAKRRMLNRIGWHRMCATSAQIGAARAAGDDQEVERLEGELVIMGKRTLVTDDE